MDKVLYSRQRLTEVRSESWNYGDLLKVPQFPVVVNAERVELKAIMVVVEEEEEGVVLLLLVLLLSWGVFNSYVRLDSEHISSVHESCINLLY